MRNQGPAAARQTPSGPSSQAGPGVLAWKADWDPPLGKISVRSHLCKPQTACARAHALRVCLHTHKKTDEKPRSPVGSEATSAERYWSEGGSCSLLYKSKLLNFLGYVDTLKGERRI